MFSKILVPVDGSPTSYRGLKFAIDVAKKYDAEITLIHVIEEPTYAYSYSPMGGMMLPGEYYTGMREHAEKLLSKRKKELTSKGVQARTLIRRGNPTVQILKASRGFDLIVMGSRGLGRLRSLMLGSVSNSVVQQAKVPVLIVRPEGG
jgi:nucleotide-binding universal stress UspA family protein